MEESILEFSVCLEFTKRSDPDLPFYYHTTSDRFYEGNMPAFDEPCEKPKQPKRREQVHGDVSGRVTMAIRVDRSIRTFHNLPVELPPPPPLRRITPAFCLNMLMLPLGPSSITVRHCTLSIIMHIYNSSILSLMK